MYQWIVFVHIGSVLGLLIVHPVTIAFHLKEERVDIRIRELLEVTESASRLRWVFFSLIIGPTTPRWNSCSPPLTRGSSRSPVPAAGCLFAT
jgi:hypothetical protein